MIFTIFRNESRNSEKWLKIGRQNFGEMICAKNIEILVKFLEMTNKCSQKLCQMNELVGKQIFLLVGHLKTLLAPGIQDPLHATGYWYWYYWLFSFRTILGHWNPEDPDSPEIIYECDDVLRTMNCHSWYITKPLSEERLEKRGLKKLGNRRSRREIQSDDQWRSNMDY